MDVERERRSHAKESSIDPLLAVPREETHDCCYWPAYGVLQVALRKRGGADCSHDRRGTHQGRKGRERADHE
ncbi:unnamed protein product [Spirodela intermedia]|uniref:Uncharacterized protein n=1 Tax=Spirodela intermedia TaxID=51605 RepID=A0A7I8KSW1_SPIIN|nr:unnamed protein product [Spirodela intermedia]